MIMQVEVKNGSTETERWKNRELLQIEYSLWREHGW